MGRRQKRVKRPTTSSADSAVQSAKQSTPEPAFKAPAIHGIPDEILLLIFKVASNLRLSSSTYNWGRKSQLNHWATAPPVNRTPWSIAAVCQRWRAISLTSPQLWAAMEVKCPNSSNVNRALSEYERTKLQLVRSGETVPFALSFEEWGPWGSHSRANCCDYQQQIFQQCANRSRELTLLLAPDRDRGPDDFPYIPLNPNAYYPIAAAFLNSDSIHFPRLEKLFIANAQHGWADKTAFRHKLPLLQHLSLHNCPISRSFSDLPLPWTTISSLQLQSCTIYSFTTLLQALQSSPQIRFLKIAPGTMKGMDPHRLPEDDSPPSTFIVNLPSLKSLSIGCDTYPKVARCIFTHLQVPNLEHLNLLEFPDRWSDVTQYLLTFIGADSPISDKDRVAPRGITVLGLPGTSNYYDNEYLKAALKVLQALPALQRLYYTHHYSHRNMLPPVVREFLSLLVESAQRREPSLWPDFREIHLQGCKVLLRSEHTGEALLSRCKPTPNTHSATNTEGRTLSQKISVHLEIDTEESKSIFGEPEDVVDEWVRFAEWLREARSAGVLTCDARVGSWDEDL